MYEVYVVIARTGDMATMELHFDAFKIWKTHEFDVLIRFKSIDYDFDSATCSIHSTI